jgi:2-polyprenyl-3-methyl-5-hydroxy-6-metoxy-1,4-benzoquinol methylase
MNNDSRFRRMTWEEKAKLSAAYAIQTNEVVEKLTNSELTDLHNPATRLFFDKGVKVFNEHIKATIETLNASKKSDQKLKIFEFGVGVGRILTNLDTDTADVYATDISETQVELAKKICPKANIFRNTDNHLDFLEDNYFDLVFTFAVLKHIGSLREFDTAIENLSRVLKFDGYMLLNLHSIDFDDGSQGLSHVDFEDETYSVDISQMKVVKKRKNDKHWSGVRVSLARLIALLEKSNVTITRVYQHNQNQKPGNIWVQCRKYRP